MHPVCWLILVSNEIAMTMPLKYRNSLVLHQFWSVVRRKVGSTGAGNAPFSYARLLLSVPHRPSTSPIGREPVIASNAQKVVATRPQYEHWRSSGSG